MPDGARQPRDLDADFGFGSRIADQGRTRVLNQDGSFNVRRRGVGAVRSLNLFHFLMTMSAPRFLAVMVGVYLATNLVFGLAYFACGPGAFVGGTGTTTGGRFLDAFFFSVQTLATIGYGRVSPFALAANVLVTVEALVGLLGFALVTGIVFSRFARPRAEVIFSRTSVVAPYQGMTAFMFRLANGRSNQLLEVRATVSFIRMEQPDGSAPPVRRFYQLRLERQKVTFLPLHWVVVHPIDEESPLHGVTPESLAASDAEFFVLLSATDETFSQQVYARSSYRPAEVIWGAKFVDMFLSEADGVPAIDLRRLHETVRV